MAAKHIPTSIDKLPALKEGHVRLVHLTKANDPALEKILSKGLSYRGQLSSVAAHYMTENEVKYYPLDQPLKGPGTIAVVIDLPINEYRRHEDPRKAPGFVEQNYIVGVIDSYQAQQSQQKKKPQGLDKLVGCIVLAFLFLSIMFYSPNITGYAVASFSPSDSNKFGFVMAFIAVVVGVIFLKRERK